MELLSRPLLASLLIEMDNRIGFTEALAHAGGKVARSPELVRNIYACLIAQAVARRAEWRRGDAMCGDGSASSPPSILRRCSTASRASAPLRSWWTAYGRP